MKITYHGHSCFKIETGTSQILIDPFLTGNPKFTGSVDWVAQGVTHVALTHGHDDHVGDTIEICKKTSATLMAPVELAQYLQNQGVENVDMGNVGGTLVHGDFRLSFVRADHSSSTLVDGKPLYLGPATGIVIRTHNHSVYHMGDTDIFSGMALINEVYAPNIGIVPIGDRFTMGARTAALACKRFFNFQTIIPCHYGSFPIIDQTPVAFIEEMENENVAALGIGGFIEV